MLARRVTDLAACSACEQRRPMSGIQLRSTFHIVSKSASVGGISVIAPGASSRRPCATEFAVGRQPEVHPERHVDQDDLRGTLYPLGYRGPPPEAIDDPLLPGNELLMLLLVVSFRSRKPPGLPQVSIDLDVPDARLSAEAAHQR